MIEAPSVAAALALELAERLPAHIVRAGMETVLVEAAGPAPDLLDLVRGLVAEIELPAAEVDRVGPEVRVSVRYDGPDLETAALVLGCGGVELAAAHAQQHWEVAMLGFAPGFGYLVPRGNVVLPWERLPRREHPRPEVREGSVAIAAGMSAVYPAVMPGGWHLIGVTEARLFDPENEEDPTVLHPGDLVRFESQA